MLLLNAIFSIVFILLGIVKFGISLKVILFSIIYFILNKISFDDWKSHTINVGMLLIFASQSIFAFLVIGDVTIAERLLGAIIISIPFHIISLTTKSIGIGDVFLIAIGGLILGYRLTIPATFIGLVLGALWGIVIKIRTKKQSIAFGPFLSLGMVISMLIWW